MITFHWSDYFIFGLLLLIYAVIGLYFKFKYDYGFKRNKTVIKEYFLANRKMGLIPVTASILVSFMSAISILGTVSEVYVSGIEYAVIGFSYFIAFPLAAYVYLPTFYRLKIVSAHEYLELRFGRLIRICVSIVFIIQMIFYISVVLYAPALAFSQVSGLSLWISILSTGIVCTFYTALGGMRAVIWTDLMQFVIMLCGMLTVVIVGVIRVGGVSAVWEISKKNGRINLFNFNPDPFSRHSFWSLFFGGTGMCMSIYATNQAQVQRYLSCRTEKIAIGSLMINTPLTFGFLWLLIGAGLVTFSSLATCDPLTSGEINKGDQIFPYFVIRLLHQYSPLPGLFLSTIFAAGLSTISSGINSLSSVIMEDILSVCPRNDVDIANRVNRTALYAKIIALTLGAITITFAFLFSLASSTVLQIALSLFGMAGGPILSVFTMGLIIPCVNAKGAICGLIGSILVTFWIGIGAIVTGSGVSNRLPVNVSGCLNNTNNATVINVTNKGFSIYNLSYLYYTLVAIVVCTILSIFVSAITGFNSQKKISKNLFFVLVPKLSKYWPVQFPDQITDVVEIVPKETTNFIIASSEVQLTQHISIEDFNKNRI
uniref:Slc5a-1 n=1 Tax=Schmidtea mediterranea TaxID=79327 RepID=A0A0H3YIU0_SCHMD|nr:slc5a-1 [Schmidtea mediterranea]